MSQEFVQVVTPFGIELRSIIRRDKQISLDDFITKLIGDTIEDLDIPIFLRNGLKYIARRDIQNHLGIDKSDASRYHNKLEDLDLMFHPRESVSRSEYGLRKQSWDDTNFEKGGRSLILISVDDAIQFISYGQSNEEKLTTIHKLIKELRKYRNIAKSERKARIDDSWRHLLNYDDLAYEFLKRKMYEGLPKWDAYKLLWDEEVWRIGKKELYRYFLLKGYDLPYFKDTRLHHPEYHFKHLFTKGKIIHKKVHKSGT